MSIKIPNPFRPNRATDPLKAIEYIKYKLSLENYKLLSDKYENAQTRLLVQCCRNHQPYPTNWNTINQGRRCRDCMHENQRSNKSIKKSFLEILRETQRLNLKPLFKEHEYTNSHDRLPYECLKCCDVSYKSFSNISAGKKCRKCAVKDSGQKQRHKFDIVLNDAEKVWLLPLFIEEDYQSKRFDHPYLCVKCGKIIWKTPKVVKIGHGCQSCSAKNSGAKKRLSLKEVRADAAKMNLKIIGSSKPYQNQGSKLRYFCLSCRKEELRRPADVRAEKGCSNCSSGISERICREYFSQILNSEFPNKRASWLVNSRGNPMSLDGYSEELQIAFEHDGEQHYSLGTHFITTNKKLKQRILDDGLKADLCRENGVTLIRIPALGTRTPRHELQILIINSLREAGIKVPKEKEKLRIIPGLNKLFIDQAKIYEQNVAKLCIKIQISDWMGLRSAIDHKCTSCGYKWFRQPCSLDNKKGCPKCAGNAPLTRAEILKTIERFGAVLLKYDFSNRKSTIKVKCVTAEHKYEGRYYDFQKSWKAGCPICRIEKKRNEITENIDIMLTKRNLRRVGPYVNANVPIEVQCIKCNELYSSKYHKIIIWKNDCRMCDE